MHAARGCPVRPAISLCAHRDALSRGHADAYAQARLTVERKKQEDERLIELAKEQAHEEQERVSKRMSSSMIDMSPVGSLPDSSSSEEDDEEVEHGRGGEGPEGELVWEGVKDGQMM